MLGFLVVYCTLSVAASYGLLVKLNDLEELSRGLSWISVSLNGAIAIAAAALGSYYAVSQTPGLIAYFGLIFIFQAILVIVSVHLLHISFIEARKLIPNLSEE